MNKINVGLLAGRIKKISAIWGLVLILGVTAQAQDVDPYAANNGVYPTRAQWAGPMRVANLDYEQAVADLTDERIKQMGEGYKPRRKMKKGSQVFGFNEGPISGATAQGYMMGIKSYLTPTIGPLINDGSNWNPKDHGWYDMVWIGQGEPGADGKTDPNSGRDPIGSTYTGQIVPRMAYANRNNPGTPLPAGPVQNHAVMYYNTNAASMLAKLWSDPYNPELDAIDFPEGSVVLKIEALTSTPQEWPVLTNAGSWTVFRPSTQDQLNPPPGGAKPQVLTVHPFQMSIAVKDTNASPVTGWVFMAFVYDTNSPGATPWDRFTAVGAQWGNDPQLANDPSGLGAGGTGTLQETWINPSAPPFIHATLGWGGRLAGPMDVATRSNVLFTSGNNDFVDLNSFAASACMSCHLAAEFPWTRNLYPAPNRAFPRDGEPFVLYEPGSKDWAKWYQNYSGTQGVSNKDVPRGLDYDFAIMFALSAWSSAVGDKARSFENFDVH